MEKSIEFDLWLMPQGDCLVWTYKLNRFGYGAYSWRRPDGSKGNGAHVFMWERFRGRVPNGKELHHTCLNRACCNVLHLQVLSHKEHKALHVSMSPTWACGHPRIAGQRMCRECWNAYCRDYQREWRKTHPRKSKTKSAYRIVRERFGFEANPSGVATP